MSLVKRFWSGDFSRRFLAWYWYPTAMAFLVGGIALSLQHYPGPFDWRYRVVSSLFNQRDNPQGLIYSASGVAVACFMLLPLCGFLWSRLRQTAPRTSAFSFYSLRIGLLAAVLGGIERIFFPQIETVIEKMHEYISLVAFLGVFLGVVGYWLALAWQVQRRRDLSPGTLLAIFLISGAPMIGAASSQGYLYFVPNNLGWVGPHWAEQGVPLYLSFAFWEWIASVAVFFYLYAMLWMVKDVPLTNSRKVPKARRKAS